MKDMFKLYLVEKFEPMNESTENLVAYRSQFDLETKWTNFIALDHKNTRYQPVYPTSSAVSPSMTEVENSREDPKKSRVLIKTTDVSSKK